jgi:hypothetical protein
MINPQYQLLDFLKKKHDWFKRSAEKVIDDRSSISSVFSELNKLIQTIHNQFHVELDYQFNCELNGYLPVVRRAWYLWELEREQSLSNKILSSGVSQVDTYISKVHQLIQLEGRIAGINKDYYVAVLGTGPLPLTQILLSRAYGCKSVGIEKDHRSVDLANKVINKLHLSHCIQIIESDALDYSFHEVNHIMVLADCEPKKEVFHHIHRSTKANVTYRSAYKLYKLLSPQVNKGDIELYNIKQKSLDQSNFFELVLLHAT